MFMIILGKLQYFTNLNSGHLVMIPRILTIIYGARENSEVVIKFTQINTIISIYNPIYRVYNPIEITSYI